MSRLWMHTAVLTASAGFVGLVLFHQPAPIVQAQEAQAQKTQAAPKTVADFRLKDSTGKDHALSEYLDRKPGANQPTKAGDGPFVVVAFVGVECPLAKLYGPRLEELRKTFADQGVAVLGVNANAHDSPSEISEYVKQHALGFPLLKDVGNRVADQFQATRTPEVFVVDRHRKIRYHGRIDDQYAVGVHRNEPKHHDLKQALSELTAGKPVSTPATVAVGCLIGRIQEPVENPTVTYAQHIAPILNKRCVECHRAGEIGPFALTDPQEAVGWAETLAEVVRDERMPPWHASPKHGSFRNDRRMTDAEKQLLYDWVADGAPLGDLSKLPPTPSFTTGWQLPREPELVLNVTPKPYEVPATGEVKYQYFMVDPGFTEDKWVHACEIQPGNRAVVHHVLMFARGPNAPDDFGGGLRGFLGSYVPGLRPEPYLPGMAKRIPAGSKLIFQMHYTPIGSPQFDQSKVGFLFVDRKDVAYEVLTTSSVQRRLNIPPNTAAHQVTASSRVSRPDALLLAMMPHMHLRGSAFRYEATLPGGRQVLLDIPHYDFNWQTGYLLSKPLPIPAGAEIHCTALFDNSSNNPHNPDPTQTVRWGDQTWEEMMIGYYDLAVPLEKADAADAADADPDLKAAQKEAERRVRSEALLKRYDANNDGKIARSEVPAALHPIFNRLDQDQNDVVVFEEILRLIDLLPRR